MNIFFITRGYPSEKHKQLGNFEAVQAHALVKLGHQVTIISLNFLSILNWDILGTRHRVDEEIDVYEKYFLAIPSNNLMPKFLKVSLLKKKLDKIYCSIVLKKGKPDIIHSHYLQITAFAILLKEKYKIPLVCTEHWSVINNSSIPVSVLKLGKKTYPLVDEIISVSSMTSRSIKKHFGRESNVIFNMVDDLFFEELTENVNENCFTLLSIGEMNDYRKGFDLLLKSFAKLRKQIPAQLLIVGVGRKQKKLKKMSRELEVSDNVEFLGEKSALEIRNLIQSSSALVLSSRIETFGVVLIEAMAQGKPVIATCCGGPEEFITEKCGYLVNVEDVDGLCNAMLMMNKNITDFKTSVIREYCRINFSEKSISEQIVHIYADVLNRYKKNL